MWEDNSVGDAILHGQWSSPSVGKIGGVVQVVSAQGDGWVRGYEALDRQEAVGVRHQPEGLGVAEDAQRSDRHAGDLREQGLHRQRPGSGARRRRRPPLRHRRHQARRHHPDRPALALRQDPPVDLDRRDLRRAAVTIADFSGFLHCLDAKTGKAYWTHDMLAAVWGSPMVIDGKVYLGDEDGDVVVLEAGKEKKVIAEMNMGSSVYATPVPANGTLFIMNRNQLLALAETKKASSMWQTVQLLFARR